MAAHHVSLVERHAFFLPVPRPCPEGPRLLELRHRTWSQLSDLAEGWAVKEGIEIEVDPYEQQDHHGRPAQWGVRFTIVVGKGLESADGRRKDLPAWTWSIRWKQWQSRFRRMERPHMRSVPSGNVVPFERDSGA